MIIFSNFRLGWIPREFRYRITLSKVLQSTVLEIENNIVYLINSLKIGRKKSFDELFNLFSHRIYRLARKLHLNHDDAEEIVQDTFLSIWERRTFLNPEKDFKAYILKIAKSNIIKFFKRKSLYFAFEQYVLKENTDCDNNTEQLILYRDLLEILESEIKKLPPGRKEIFLLSRHHNMTNDEIAEKLGVSRRTVENQIYRTLKLLKDRIQFLLALLGLVFLS